MPATVGRGVPSKLDGPILPTLLDSLLQVVPDSPGRAVYIVTPILTSIPLPGHYYPLITPDLVGSYCYYSQFIVPMVPYFWTLLPPCDYITLYPIVDGPKPLIGFWTMG